jgi:hypothetical protein
MKKVLFGVSLTAILLLLVAVATPSFATPTPLAPGGTVAPGTDGGSFATLATASYNFNFAGDTGTVTEWVGNLDTNPFGASDLAFVYQITVTSGTISALSAANFGNALTDVAYAGCGIGGCNGFGSIAPTSATRSGNGNVVRFLFNPELTGGQVTYALEIETNATQYGNGSVGLIDGSAQGFPGFAPVPEPASLSLLGTGLLALGGGLRKKLLA